MRDWDDAYANSAHIAGSDKMPTLWAERAAAYRAGLKDFRPDIAHGSGERQRFDLILPDGDSKGLVVFVHGGYWMRFDKSTWTDLAEGARSHGWTVALPSYTLTPTARISDITAEITAAIAKAASLVSGPIRLACAISKSPTSWRVKRVGLHGVALYRLPPTQKSPLPGRCRQTIG